MARKRKNLKGLDYQTPEYWDSLLKEEGLSMDAGTSRRLAYVGGTAILDDLQGQQQAGTRDKAGDLGITYKPNSDDEE